MPPARAPDDALGPVISEWKVGLRRRVLLSVALVAFPGSLVPIGVAGDAPLVAWTAGIATVGAIAATLFCLSAIRVVVHEGGIERRGRGSPKRVAWTRLAHYQLDLVDMARLSGALGGALGALIAALFIRWLGRPTLRPRAVVLTDVSGTKVVVPSSLERYDELVAALVPALTDRLFVRDSAALERGDVVQFGAALALRRDVGITVKGLLGKAQVLPLGDAASAEVERALLVIRKKGSDAPWATLSVRGLRNVDVFRRFVVREQPGQDPDGLPLAWTV
jgi:hypothetical protein